MEARINVITLGVSDLERSLAFYRGLGLESQGIVGTEFVGDESSPGGAAAMFDLRGGLILSLYGRADLAKDANIPVPPPQSGEFSMGYLVENREEVDALLKEAESLGATVTERPHDRPWGIYSAYFLDPDGHLWEIIWNPRVDIAGS
jgi:catechol 2,3-dioxygenase-like lactoylglutathione lyase family enzyme